MWIWILLLTVISIYNTVYGFLPERYQKKLWVKSCGILTAVVILIYGLLGTIVTYTNESYAVVAPDGKLIKVKNFDWKIITSSSPDDRFPLYTIEERFGNATDIEVIPRKEVPVDKYMTIDGLVIKFLCEREEVPEFEIRIK